jgi:hypothetical protein
VVQESDQGVEVRFSGEPSEDVQRSLMDLAKSLDEHISALHAAGRELLMRRAKAGAPVPSGIRFSITVGQEAGRVAADSPGPGSECYTARYICGKGPSGYIYCEREVCIEVEPVTVLPG